MISLYAFNFFGLSLSKDPEQWGQFGDYLGGTLNPLLGFLTLVVVLYTVLLQHELLQSARDQVDISARELAKTSDAMQQQVDSLRRNEFRGTFFSLVELQQQILSGMKVGDRVGRDAFESYYRTLKGHYKNWTGLSNYRSSFNSPSGLSEYESLVTSKAFVELYQERLIDFPERLIWANGAMYEQFGSDLGHYFRNLFNLFKLIDQSELSLREKRTYSNFVRAQLSSYEVALLFYNCMTPFGFHKFYPLVERYGLIKHLGVQLLLDGSHISWYPIGARSGSPVRFADEGNAESRSAI